MKPIDVTRGSVTLDPAPPLRLSVAGSGDGTGTQISLNRRLSGRGAGIGCARPPRQRRLIAPYG